jgi:pimeloyl-ACP methyl ester carboxylesterase
MIRRRFLDTADGQLHYRVCGEGHSGIPLLLLHGAPATSVVLEPLLTQLGQSIFCIALDLPGMGDSNALAVEQPTLAQYGDAVTSFVKSLGLSQINLYGTLSGSRIAIDMASKAPVLIDKLILDILGLVPPEKREEMIRQYPPSIVLDPYGSHLTYVWNVVRDQYLFYPWYNKTAAARRELDLPNTHVLQRKCLEVLKSADGIAPLLRAALAADAVADLARLRLPMLVSADAAVFAPTAKVLQTPSREPLTAPPELVQARAQEILAFLQAT